MEMSNMTFGIMQTTVLYENTLPNSQSYHNAFYDRQLLALNFKFNLAGTPPVIYIIPLN